MSANGSGIALVETHEPASEERRSREPMEPGDGNPPTHVRSPIFWTVDSMDEGLRLVVHNVSCKIGDKQTLHDVTGVVEPGEFYGVMGPSGAGKTMLMDIVCFRKSLGKVRGVVLYDNRQPTKEFVGHNVAYVEQQITVQPAFTVEEAITFSAMLKRPRTKFTRKEIEVTVDHVIEQLGLHKIRKARVGNSRLVRGISGGEARRVSIGISLVQLTKPGLLCLDEPTTGLDSAIGNDILKLVRGCADEGERSLPPGPLLLPPSSSAHLTPTSVCLSLFFCFLCSQDGRSSPQFTTHLL